MQCDFSYLKPYVNNPSPIRKNIFYSVPIEHILEAEGQLGYPFPSQLKEFYQQIGYGVFRHNYDYSHTINPSNRLIDPNSIAAIKLEGFESGQIKPDVEFEADELPFFEVSGGGAIFFTLKPLSDNPNRVWDDDNILEESFERFIWRLYYERPDYYKQYWDV